MATKSTVKNSTKKSKKPKKVYKPEDLKAHHAKPYRKRHYGLLVSSLVSVLALGYLITSTGLANHNAVKSAKDLVSNILGKSSSENEQDLKVTSAYGFNLSFNPELLQASALDGVSNSLYVGSELSATRAYSAVKITPISSDPTSEASGGSLTAEYHTDIPVGTSADLAKLEAQLVGAKNPNFSIVKSSNPTIDGVTLLRSEWAVSKKTTEVASTIRPTIISYTSVINNTPFTLVLNSGVGQSEELKSVFGDVLDSLGFQPPLPIVLPLGSTEDKRTDGSSLSLLDRLMMTKGASAESFLNENNASEKVSLLYGSSVVKVYNFYCMDISLGGQKFVQQSCSASTGSGFFIGSQGYVATNGHVVVNDPLSIAITYSFEQLNKGNSFYFSVLAQVSGLTQADIDAGATNKDKVKIAVDKFYKIPSSQIATTNKVENILVGLGEQQPDLQKLLDATKYSQAYVPADGTKKAEVIDYNYRAIDGTQTGVFTASDVALLKIDGSNYPSTKLGDISSLIQGSGLSIIGYPGAASTNPLVEASESIATLTSGKVSSIKSASGSDNQLIETDATIGHGNSGGPAFNDSGEVVGIATYTIDGSGDGNGVFNYVRDIADLEELATKNSVDTSLSKTQEEWNEAVRYIYDARYSKAIDKLKEVQGLYPEHPRVEQLLALAQQKIDSGEEAKDFPTLAAAIASILGITLLLVSILLIVHHSRKHTAYKEHVASGQITPPISLADLHNQQSPPQTPPAPLDNQQ